MLISEWLDKINFTSDDEIKKYFFNLLKVNKNLADIHFIKENLDSIIFIIYKFANDPLETQKNILNKLNCNFNDLVKMNFFIRESIEIQELILKKGSGEKYWNSILPFAKHTDKVLNYEYSFPLRIAFFPGISCMFYCGFCGRNQNAKYPIFNAKEGIEKLKSVIDEIHQNTAISISGGLEPLTNPFLGDLISHARSKNLKVPLITNAYSMTDAYINKNLGLWDSDSVRVSLYGVDEQTYNFVTRSIKSFKMVKKNSINFLSKRNNNNPKIKFGFNYIILKENIKDIRKLCEYIYEINNASNSKVDFLTLREDFGSVTGHNTNLDIIRKYRLNGFLNKNDRKYLKDELLFLEEFKNKNFPEMNIDYGYALKGVINNKFDYYLVRAEDDEVSKVGYPQLSVAIDLFGDVFLYREAGFLDREGNQDFIIGRIEKENNLEKIITNHLKKNDNNIINNSSRFLDSFDHLLTKLVSQAKNDKNIGIPFSKGPIKQRSEQVFINLGNNWYN